MGIKIPNGKCNVLISRHVKQKESHLWHYRMDWSNGCCCEDSFTSKKAATDAAKDTAQGLRLEIIKV